MPEKKKKDDFKTVVYTCSCCGKSTSVLGTNHSPWSYFEFVAHSRGFFVYENPFEDICLCPNCSKVFSNIMYGG